MSIATEIKKAFPADVVTVKVDDTYHYGQKAVRVSATLTTRQIVEGTFNQEEKAGFGGIEFNNRYDVVALMSHKIKSVLDGTAEGTQ